MSYPEPYVYEEHNRMVRERFKRTVHFLVSFLTYPFWWILWALKPIARIRVMFMNDGFIMRKTNRKIKEFTIGYFHKRWIESLKN